MRYKAKTIPALEIVLGGLPDTMRVKAEPGTRLSAKTVGELRKMATWPDNLVLTIPEEYDRASTVKVSTPSINARVPPKQ